MILYIDPGTGSLILNALIALISSALYFFRKIFYRGINIKKEKNQRISIFSEGNQYLNTFKPIVEGLIANKIHFNYFTLDYKDEILDIENKFINSRFLGLGSIGKSKFNSIKSEKLISTTPNIGNKNFPLKRPKRVKELIHVWHSISDISYYKKGSLDSYDTILNVGDFQNKSIRKIEKVRNLKTKNLFSVGLPYYDFFEEKLKSVKSNPDHILIASSWGDKGLLKSFGLEMLNKLKDYKIIIRPHPQSFISEPELIKELKFQFRKEKNIIWDELPCPIKSISKSFLLISDTSSIRYDFAFLTGKPVITLKINKDKLSNYEADDLSSSWDEENEKYIGYVLESKEINLIEKRIKSLLTDKSYFEQILNLKKRTLTEVNSSAINIVNYLKSN